MTFIPGGYSWSVVAFNISALVKKMFINVQNSDIIMYIDERRSYNASNKTDYRFEKYK